MRALNFRQIFRPIYRTLSTAKSGCRVLDKISSSTDICSIETQLLANQSSQVYIIAGYGICWNMWIRLDKTLRLNFCFSLDWWIQNWLWFIVQIQSTAVVNMFAKTKRNQTRFASNVYYDASNIIYICVCHQSFSWAKLEIARVNDFVHVNRKHVSHTCLSH